MKSYTAGYEVLVTFELLDPNGDPIVPTAASYQVHDETGVELAADTLVVTGEETRLTVVVSAADNLIDGIERHAARTVTLVVSDATATVVLQQTYLLERVAFLQVPSQSGQTLAQALLLAREFQQAVMEGWGFAEDIERTSALLEAWARLSRIRLVPWRGHEITPDAASFELKCGKVPLNEMTPEQWALAPAHFVRATRRAQLVEAAVILGGDPTWDRRQEGLISKTVGESSEMFRSGRPIASPVSPRAMGEISGYVRRTVSIARV